MNMKGIVFALPLALSLFAQTACDEDDAENSIVTIDGITYEGTVLVDGIAYSKDKPVLVKCPKARTGLVNIVDGITEIGGSAFSGCSLITGVFIPATVTDIGFSAFFECKSLTSVTIPASVDNIGDSAFENCDNLTNVEFVGNKTSITADKSFPYGTSLKAAGNVTSGNSYKMEAGVYTRTGAVWKKTE